MTTGQRYHYNFLGFPGGEGEFVGIGTGNDDEDCPVGWWEFEVFDNSTKETTHRVYMNPALLATVVPK